jgi:hypothetical protein
MGEKIAKHSLKEVQVLFLEMHYDIWVEFEHPDGGTILTGKSEYSPEDWGHAEDGTYHYFGAGGVQAEGTVKEETGWAWVWRDPADPDENPYTGVFKTEQEAFQDAFDELYVNWEEENRLGTADDWYCYADRHNLNDQFIDRILTADNSHI